MQWSKAIGKFFLLAIKPLRHAESVWGWVDLILQLLIMLGILASVGFGISIEEVRWLLTIVIPSLFALLFLIAGIRLQYRLSTIDDLARIKPGDIIKNKTINVSVLFEIRELHMVDNVTFHRCILKGPCLVALKGQNNFNHTSFWGSENHSEHLILADETRLYNGIGLFMHCNFEYCRFENIAWLLNQNNYDIFLQFRSARG